MHQLSAVAADDWNRRNAVTLMRRGKGPLTPAADLPSQGLTTPASRLICRFFQSPITILTPLTSHWLSRGGHFGMTSIC